MKKAVEADNLRARVRDMEAQEREAEKASTLATSLQEEVQRLRQLLQDSEAETKIAKDELEQEKKDKDEVRGKSLIQLKLD